MVVVVEEEEEEEKESRQARKKREREEEFWCSIPYPERKEKYKIHRKERMMSSKGV